MARNGKRLAVVLTCVSVLMALAGRVASEEDRQPRALDETEPGAEASLAFEGRNEVEEGTVFLWISAD